MSTPSEVLFSLEASITLVKEFLMTASVRLSRKKAPINTRGTKYKTTAKLRAFCMKIMIIVHPSSVTHWNTAKKA
eukprot:CAMPEP_0204907576 /NCGR_PEP_ID=MMETSP1397-20131031/6695_1 /ASSEMBLY_ACC=CAM_ASM_000891 /TAXON_ID=49980 /ORGANISM="Climacostomum Climacostomum virens, Strain Stock W-24" /LENGTH=74 /DNA_ID=CAMNT_0052076775 /DNA_START=30 /DNA_END=254 /DNA_ORIENTATION=+